MNERRKHSASQCAWGSTMTEIKTTLGILVDQIKVDTEHRAETDDKQYDLLRKHTGEISGLQANVKNLDKRINNVKNNPAPALAPVAANCPEPSLWQAIKKIKKVWFLFLFLGGAAGLKLVAVILQHIGEIGAWLQGFVSTIE